MYDLDKELRESKTYADSLRNKRNTTSNEIGICMRNKEVDKANELKEEVVKINNELKDLEEKEIALETTIKEKMMVIPNIIDESVPIGKDDSENVEIEKFGEPIVPSYEIPYHADICESLSGLDKESAGRTSGNG